MGKVRVSGYAVSLDGFAAGPDQNLNNPLGKRGPELMQWFFPTRSFRAMQGLEGGTTGEDNEWAERAMSGVGAWIMGRNMFGPIRGPWPDNEWKGWWGDEPPYHVPTYVLTHHAREPLPMEGNTTFYFVTDGIHSALEQARAVAKDKDIRIGGGASTVRQYLKEGLIDELHLVISPVMLGAGESLYAGIDLPALGYTTTQHLSSEGTMHIVLSK